MISFITGELLNIHDETIVISVGGMGLEILVSPLLSDKLVDSIGEEISLHTHFSFISSRNNITPFIAGFERVEEKELYEKLLTVPGIGSKVALSILSIESGELVSAINEGRVDKLTTIPGIGKSKARQIITSLAGKVVMEGEVGDGTPSGELWDMSREALLQLGYNKTEIDKILRRVSKELKEPESVEEIINRAFER